jgi:hypothetical protein
VELPEEIINLYDCAYPAEIFISNQWRSGQHS